MRGWFPFQNSSSWHMFTGDGTRWASKKQRTFSHENNGVLTDWLSDTERTRLPLKQINENMNQPGWSLPKSHYECRHQKVYICPICAVFEKRQPDWLQTLGETLVVIKSLLPSHPAKSIFTSWQHWSLLHRYHHDPVGKNIRTSGIFVPAHCFWRRACSALPTSGGKSGIKWYQCECGWDDHWQFEFSSAQSLRLLHAVPWCLTKIAPLHRYRNEYSKSVTES